MSVTKSEPKSTRKASRKPAKTQETVLSALLAQTEEVSVPLASLIKSPLNVRTVPYSAESVSELADSIKGVGLLQNLVVHALPGDRHGVAAGGRRLAALNMLAERGIIPADWPVRVKIISQELATAASMTENGHRRDMHPAEQIAGFCAMAQEGKTPAQIGDLLGYSPRHVQRMLKLADLAPVILDALAEDLITTEHCQALALENDTARQVQVFEAACQSGWGGKPEVQTIRRLVTESEVAVAGNSKFRFVGADAFSPDELRTDLFSDDEGGYVDCVALDAALLEKVSGLRARYEADMEAYAFQNALADVFEVIDNANKYIDATAPWVLAKSEDTKPRLARVLYNLAETLRICTVLLQPFMPATCEKIFAQLGVDDSLKTWDSAAAVGSMPANATLHKGENIFPRIDTAKELAELDALEAAQKAAAQPANAPAEEPKAEAAAASAELIGDHEEEISFDDFCKVELRVAEVRACERMKESKKLLHLTVFDGERERCILSGIAKWFAPEDLIGKKIGIVANLAPRPMMKGKYVSEGMIFAADTDVDGGCSIAFFPDSTPAGARIH